MAGKLNPISQAEEAVNELSNSFLDWAKNQLGDLNKLIEEMDGDDRRIDAAFCEKMYDVGHNVKGLGGSFGYYLMTDIGDMLCKYTKPEAVNTDISLKTVKTLVGAMDLIISDNITGTGGTSGEKLKSQLQDLINQS